jgi:hypothetical protein
MNEEVDTENIIISKPKKSNGSYTSQISYNSKGEKLTVVMPNASLIKTKPLQQRNESMIYFKCKEAIDVICDINAYVIDNVKENSKTWFNTDMNIELIDDYFTNTLIYDKKYGDIIRLKIIGDEKLVDEFIGKTVDIEITFTQLRFYKQKFVIECVINNIKETCFLLEESQDDLEYLEDLKDQEDIPAPTFEDINNIINETLDLIEQSLKTLNNDKKSIQEKINIFEDKKTILRRTTDIHEIIKICHDLESLCD